MNSAESSNFGRLALWLGTIATRDTDCICSSDTIFTGDNIEIKIFFLFSDKIILFRLMTSN